MVPFLTHDILRLLLAEHEPPCLSLYVPTHWLVLSRGGQVVVVPAADMPAASGVAAIFRF